MTEEEEGYVFCRAQLRDTYDGSWIALGSAVKTAQLHNVDNRVMYSGGFAAIDLGLMGKDCTVAYAIPLSATGKNIYFDRDNAK